MNAITDNRIVPYPATPPDPGEAGSTFVDPFCGNLILRVTDSATFEAPGASTVSASEAQAWSADSKMFYILDRKSGGFRFYTFNPDTFSTQPGGKVPLGSPEFSYQWPGVVFGFQDLQIRRADLAAGTDDLIVDLRDYAQELGIPDTPRWYANSVSTDYWDNRSACNIGPGQDENARLVVWDGETGLTWLNTETGEFDGWNRGDIDPWQPFGIHDCRLSLNGDTLRSSGAGNNARAFWRPGTRIFQNVTPNPETPISGHTALGFDTYFGARLQHTPFQFILAPLWNIPAFDDLMKPPPPAVPGWWSDYHISTRPLSGDRTPLYISAYNAQGNPTAPGVPPTSQVPGDNEIWAVASDGTGHFWRFGHHYSSGRHNFYASPRGNVSPDGKWFLFTSDWYMTLGGEPPNQRTDVFVLQLG